MRQVPSKSIFALVGQGRVGRAWAAYLKARQLPFRVYTRASLLTRLQEDAPSLRAILLAVSDPNLESLVKDLHEAHIPGPYVHFSGSRQPQGAWGFHPLFSFTDRNLKTEEFETIPFLCNPGEAAAFRDIFPELPNPVHELSRPRDSRYHALCVLLGNLPLLIQDQVARALGKDFGLPRNHMTPFLESLLKNFAEGEFAPSSTLVAGPVARKDRASVEAHLNALRSEPPLQSLYETLIAWGWPEFHSPQGEAHDQHS